jgi:hypothetical protein
MRYLLAIALFAGLATGARACDICGCSAGGSYFGILPRFGKHFVGVRYQYSAFSSTHPPTGSESPSSSQEWFQTGELWGRYVIHPRLQLFAFLPYHHFERHADQKMTTVDGLGDASLVANWMVFNTGDSLYHNWKQAFQIGGGVKLPTGQHLIVREGLLLNPNLQPGTGTYDFPLNAIYTLRHKKWGMNTELQYRMNGVNKNGYQFGNRASTALQLFYWHNLKKCALLPQAGITGEFAQADQKNKIAQDNTGGQAVYATAGVNIYFRRIAVGMNVNQPVYQHLGNGNVHAFTAAAATLSFLF